MLQFHPRGDCAEDRFRYRFLTDFCPLHFDQRDLRDGGVRLACRDHLRQCNL